MNIGDKILKYRKLKGYSQEDIANNLNVSRQTVSKWETNQSTPDFNKIIPLCKLFGISADELLDMDEFDNKDNSNFQVIDETLKENDSKSIKSKYALFMCISIFLYFFAVIWIIFGEELGIPDNFNVSIFLGIIGIATSMLIYNQMVNGGSDKKKVLNEEKIKVNRKVKQINDIIALIFCVVYLVISFYTNAWSITWIIWIIYACVEKIVETIFKLGE